ncbi:MAG: hypothetical protein QNI84_13390 [Henriciella sp.]|nr:hypothetical protein [Henriciella sp.]
MTEITDLKPARVRFKRDWTYRELTYTKRFKEGQEITLPRTQLQKALADGVVDVITNVVQSDEAEAVEREHANLSSTDTTFHRPVQEDPPEVIEKASETAPQGE